MKLIIAGSRDLDVLPETIEGLIPHFDLAPSEIVCGGATGVDWSGHQWAVRHNRKIKMFLADWSKFGKMAGPIRNKQMAEYADELLLIWDGKSRGSANMRLEMRKLKKIVHEVILPR